MVTLCPLLAIVVLSLGADDAAEIRDIESKVLANRRAITRASLVIESNVALWKNGEKNPIGRVRTFYVDGEKVRCDVRRRYDERPSYINSPEDVTAEYFTEKRCFSDKEFFFYTDEVTTAGKKFVVRVTTRERAWKNNAYRTPNLLAWGMTPATVGVSGISHMESRIAAPHRENLRLSRAVERDVECDKIDFTLRDVFVQVWVARTMGYSVLRMQQEFDRLKRGKNTHFVDNIELDVEKDERSGTWFPVASHFQRTENGQLTREERAKATIHSLNEPLDPRVFTLAGLNIPAGMRVMRYGADPVKYWIWDGDKEVAMGAIGMIAEGPGVGGRVFFILLSTGFAILASMLIWHWSRARQTKGLRSN